MIHHIIAGELIKFEINQLIMEVNFFRLID